MSPKGRASCAGPRRQAGVPRRGLSKVAPRPRVCRDRLPGVPTADTRALMHNCQQRPLGLCNVYNEILIKTI